MALGSYEGELDARQKLNCPSITFANSGAWVQMGRGGILMKNGETISLPFIGDLRITAVLGTVGDFTFKPYIDLGSSAEIVRVEADQTVWIIRLGKTFRIKRGSLDGATRDRILGIAKRAA